MITLTQYYTAIAIVRISAEMYCSYRELSTAHKHV